jgi:putative FmdB family regulatory protein
MPLYEYECAECHRRTEKIQKFSDPELTTCPHCGGPLHRTVTAPAIQFKGSGWYKDLYSSAKPATATSADSAPAASGSSSEGSAAPAKSEGSSAESKGNTPAAATAPTPSTT